MDMPKPLVLTMGDPTGIGPEIIAKAFVTGQFDQISRPLLVAGDTGVLLKALRLFTPLADAVAGEGPASYRLVAGDRHMDVRALSDLPAENLAYGRPDRTCGQAMVDYVEWACDRCLAGEAAGMVTGPINKAAIREAGHLFPGHTELLAERCGTERVVMMLAGTRLRVCLVTTHLALRAVTGSLTTGDILATISITDQSLKKHFGLPRPRLAVLGLNPHAGEEGHFGDEEKTIIRPAIEAARDRGIEATGPYSADTLFHFAVQGKHDAVVCMYHDQGLIPLKLLHFEDGVNVTLGLPIIRTSVDHGTAYDLAGTGRASEKSLVAAVRMAEEMAGH